MSPRRGARPGRRSNHRGKRSSPHMKRMRIMGLGLAAIFAMTALFAASASAEAPEYGRCLAHTGGKWKTSGCTTEAKATTEQKFEWYPYTGKAANGEEKPVVKKGFK